MWLIYVIVPVRSWLFFICAASSTGVSSFLSGSGFASQASWGFAQLSVCLYISSPPPPSTSSLPSPFDPTILVVQAVLVAHVNSDGHGNSVCTVETLMQNVLAAVAWHGVLFLSKQTHSTETVRASEQQGINAMFCSVKMCVYSLKMRLCAGILCMDLVCFWSALLFNISC